MTTAPELADEGRRVVVRTIRPTDVDVYRRAVLQSRTRLARWNPVDPDDLMRHLARQSDVHRTFLVLARQDEGSHGIVGRVNVTNIVRGRFQSGVLGYDAFDPYAGRGLFAEGLSLVVGLALRPHREGLGLHRVEANVQPGNVASAGVLRSLGFRHEGRSPRMLLLAGPGDGERWRDHERYAVTAEEWPAPAYRRVEQRRLVVLVAGPAADRRQQLAAALSTELGLPLLVGAPASGAPFAAPTGEASGASSGVAAFAVTSGSAASNYAASDPPRSGAAASGPAGSSSAPSGSAASGSAASGPATTAAASDAAAPRGAVTSATVADAGAPASRSGAGPQLAAPALWHVLAGCPTGAVVDAPWGPQAASEVRAGLHAAGVREADATLVWCVGSAARASGGRTGGTSGGWTQGLTGGSPQGPTGGSTSDPSGWGLAHVVPVEPSPTLAPAQVTRIALLARASRGSLTAR